MSARTSPVVELRPVTGGIAADDPRVLDLAWKLLPTYGQEDQWRSTDLARRALNSLSVRHDRTTLANGILHSYGMSDRLRANRIADTILAFLREPVAA